MARDIQSSFVPEEMRINILQISSYKDKNIKGHLENLYIKELKAFDNLSQMLFLLEETADTLNYPQRSNERRTIEERPPKNTNGKTTTFTPNRQHAPKYIAAFRIRILFRQNASWQGQCEWIEEKKSANFRSTLELIQLMDSVLSML